MDTTEGLARINNENAKKFIVLIVRLQVSVTNLSNTNDSINDYVVNIFVKRYNDAMRQGVSIGALTLSLFSNYTK